MDLSGIYAYWYILARWFNQHSSIFDCNNWLSFDIISKSAHTKVLFNCQTDSYEYIYKHTLTQKSHWHLHFAHTYNRTLIHKYIYRHTIEPFRSDESAASDMFITSLRPVNDYVSCDCNAKYAIKEYWEKSTHSFDDAVKDDLPDNYEMHWNFFSSHDSYTIF